VIGTVWNVIEGLTIIWLTIYFVYLTKSWLPIMYWSAASNIVALVISFFWMPESPKWLYTKQRYMECYKTLSKMASFNGRKRHHVIDKLMGRAADFTNKGSSTSSVILTNDKNIEEVSPL